MPIISPLIAGLEWLGRWARWVLPAGCVAALVLPGLAAFLRPAFPFFVVVVYMLAVARIDLSAVMRGLAGGRRAFWLVAGTGVVTVGGALAGWAAMRLLGLGEEYEFATTLGLLAPPIASSAAFCFLLGLNAALALEITVCASLLFPFVAPPVAALLVGAELPVTPFQLALRTAGIIAAGGVLGIVLRRWMSPARVAARKAAFDGAGAVAMVLFVIPLFDGVGEMVAARPVLAAGFLALSCLLVLGPQMVVLRGGAEAGAVAMTAGVRSVGIVVAAMPGDAVFTLFAALYQFPMYLLPLIVGRLRRSRF